ncbi:MAG: DUF962 domain-containing protein [Betaproteobacteria bacterium]
MRSDTQGTEPATTPARKFASMAEFYPFYLSEHANRTSRRLHFAGTTLGLAWLVVAAVTLNPWFLLAGFVSGYAFAWVGHYFFEHNRPATFSYPFYSFAGDWVMWSEILRGRIKF